MNKIEAYKLGYKYKQVGNKLDQIITRISSRRASCCIVTVTACMSDLQRIPLTTLINQHTAQIIQQIITQNDSEQSNTGDDVTFIRERINYERGIGKHEGHVACSSFHHVRWITFTLSYFNTD